MPTLSCGLGIGLVAGAAGGRAYLEAGFGRAFAVELAERSSLGVLGAAAFLGLYLIAAWAARRVGIPSRGADLLACAVACVPFFLLVGYEINRREGLGPATVLSPPGLRLNSIVLAVLLLAYLAVAVGLRRWHLRHPVAGHAPRLLGVPLLALALLTNGVLSITRTTQAASREEGAPAVLLLVIDALRADHLGCYGYHRDTSPAIDGLARDAVLFRQAISQGTFTKTSIASLLTGRLPHRHGVFAGEQTDDGRVVADVLPSAEHTLPELLRQRGFLTAAWVHNPHLRESMGFAQGFVAFHENERSITDIHRRFLSWLPRAGARTPFFSYLHYLDLHDPYRPRPPFDTMFGGGDPYAGLDLRRWGTHAHEINTGRRPLAPEQVEQMKALYDGQIRFIDREVGRLLRQLEARGLYDRTLIVLTSDHGEGFMEHGKIAHGYAPHEELVRVPLLVKLPGSRHAGREVATQVRLVDVLPTVLEALGAQLSRRIDGCSLHPLLAPGGRPARDGCFDEAVTAHGESLASAWIAVRTERYKYIYHPQLPAMLFDLEADPKETRDLAGVPVPEAEALRRRAVEMSTRRSSGGRRQVDEATVEELRALGYVR